MTEGNPELSCRDFPDTVLISAHRGGSERHQAATYEAYDDALNSGAEFAEFDIRKLGDGSLVVYHDAQTPDGRALSSMTYGEACGGAGYEIPMVEQVLKQIAGHLRGHLDLKEIGYEHEVIELSRRYLGNDFVATSLEDSSVKSIRSEFPETRTALSLGRDIDEESSGFTRMSIRFRELFPRRRVLECRADGIAIHRRIARLHGLSVASSMNIFAMVWTVDDDEEITRFLRDPRVAVLITNRPRRAVELRDSMARD